MTFVRTFLSIAALSTATLAASSWAASDDQHDSHHPAPTSAVQVAQATPAKPGTGMGMGGGMGAGAAMPGYAEQMKLMQNGMTMMGGMGGMGPGAMTGGKPGDMAARQGMMEQRMDMMQSMMQMMMDRMGAPPAKP